MESPTLNSQAVDSEALSMASIDAVSHCIRTLNSVRRFRRADVSPELIDYVLRHAIQAGSGKNRQPWRFIVVRDPCIKEQLTRWYQRGWYHHEARLNSPEVRNERIPDEERQISSGATLAANFDEVPVIIIACFLPASRNPADFFGGASIYPAVQNLLLAARSVGLGATLTTLQAFDIPTVESLPSASLTLYEELKQILGIPDGVVPGALIPLGWPAVSFAVGRRRPVREVTYRERWGEPWTV
ncbi:nitroreductase family protein [Streptomyces sp. Edi2]|uniref:nitroreductase family protein n=1 Tax=Streptomyces sp. Edi2 TaxID=3162528 RepID=UPI0033060EA8